MSLDPNTIRKDFPMLASEQDLAYLDSAASSQTPQQVLGAVASYYRGYRANVHRGMYRASEEATDVYEAARGDVAKLIGADASEIVFTHGTTESLNVLAQSLGDGLGDGDEVVLSAMEHHANLVPWQQIARKRGFRLQFIPMTDKYRLDMDAARGMISTKTKLVSVMHASNVLGTVNDITTLAELAHAAGALMIVDAAQTVGHTHVDVTALKADFMAFSGHKMFAPTGIGVLWGRKGLLETMEPVLFGGDMILEVFRDRSTWNEAPWKFEPGTPNIAGAIGLGAAARYIESLGLEAMVAHERTLTEYALSGLTGIDGVTVYGPQTTEGRIGTISFGIDGVHPHDVVSILDTLHIAVRGGHHCAMPLVRDLGIPGTVRASIAPYVRKEDIDQLVAGIEKVKVTFRI